MRSVRWNSCGRIRGRRLLATSFELRRELGRAGSRFVARVCRSERHSQRDWGHQHPSPVGAMLAWRIGLGWYEPGITWMTCRALRFLIVLRSISRKRGSPCCRSPMEASMVIRFAHPSGRTELRALLRCAPFLQRLRRHSSIRETFRPFLILSVWLVARRQPLSPGPSALAYCERLRPGRRSPRGQ